MTDKQARFCEEYMIDLNATQAAILTTSLAVKSKSRPEDPNGGIFKKISSTHAFSLTDRRKTGGCRCIWNFRGQMPRYALHSRPPTVHCMALWAGLEPATYGFGDHRSAN